MDKLWKQAERRIASLLGGKRVPVTGRTRGDKPDVEHEIFSIEVKHKQEFPAWLMDALDQADKSNDGTKIPLIVLHEKGKKYEDSLALLRICDIIKLMDRRQE